MDPCTGSYKLYNYGTSQVINVDDIDILVHSHDKFRHIGAEFSVGGSTFNLAIKESKNSMKFYVDHENHIVDNVEGLLGFTMAKSYEVRYFEDLLLRMNPLNFHICVGIYIIILAS